MDERGVRALQFAAVQLVGAVAVVHFAVGSEQLASIVVNGLLVEYLTRQVFVRPRAFLFVVSAVAIVGGVVAAGLGRLPRRRAYQLGIAAMLTYVVGWIAWHTVLDHGLALDPGQPPATTGAGHSHGGFVGTFVSHYVEPLLATVGTAASAQPGSGRVLLGIVAVTLELVATVVLVALLRVDPDARDGDGLLAPLRNRLG